MILFLNAFITDRGLSKLKRGLLPSANRGDVFKYSLASLSVIDWSHVIIYYELDTNYQQRRREIDEYIGSLFVDPVIYPFRNQRQPQWKVAMEKLFEIEDDDLVWFSCNDDHIFVDYETDLLERIAAKLVDLTKRYQYVSCLPTHWPEELIHSNSPAATKPGVIEQDKDYFFHISTSASSMRIVNQNLLRAWWFDHDYGDIWLPRSDPPAPTPGSVISPKYALVIPSRELVRHFDGYSYRISINTCPPLFIPEGFFENRIKISYCSEARKAGYVHVNPLKKNYSTVDPNGADLKCTLEDLPIFWRSRIARVDIATEVDRELLLRRRNEAVLKIAWEYPTAHGRTYPPLAALGAALKFNDPQDPSNELRQLKRFEISYKRRRLLPLRARSLLRRLITTSPIGEKFLRYWRARRKRLAEIVLLGRLE